MAKRDFPDCEGHDHHENDPNQIAACRAMIALCCGRNEYHDFAYDQDGTTEEAIQSILVDLRHLCDAIGIDFNEINGSALKHWISESKGRDINFRTGVQPKGKPRKGR